VRPQDGAPEFDELDRGDGPPIGQGPRRRLPGEALRTGDVQLL
jgi:hypothetical protein